jgi:Domain of unknown function (DUF5666)
MIQEPVPPTLDPGRPAPPSGGRRRRGLVGLVVVACLALAVPLIGVAIAATAQPTTSVTGASPAPTSSVKPKTDQGQGQGHGPKADKGLKGNGDAGKGSISITAIDGTKVSLKTDDGWTRTIMVSGTTVITKGAKTITVADLKVGDPVRFHQVHNTDGTYAIDTIHVVIPHLGGAVTAKTSATITVMRPDGSTATIHVSGSTTYSVKGKASAAMADVAIGSRVTAEGTFRADGSLDAVAVVGKAAKGIHPNDHQGDDDGSAPSASPAPS